MAIDTSRLRNRSSGIIGCAARACDDRKAPNVAAANVNAARTAGAVNPRRTSLDRAIGEPADREHTAATCPTHRTAPRCGECAVRASSTTATTPTGTLTKKIHRQLSQSRASRRAPAPPRRQPHHPSPRQRPPGYASWDRGRRGRSAPSTTASSLRLRRPGRTSPPPGHRSSAPLRRRRTRATNNPIPRANARRAPIRSVRDPADSKKRGEQQGVAVHHPLQAADAATEVCADRGQCDVHDDRVQRDHEESDHCRKEGCAAGSNRRGAFPGRGRGQGRLHEVHNTSSRRF